MVMDRKKPSDILSPKAPVLEVENQQWSVDKALDALKLFLGNVEEKS